MIKFKLRKIIKFTQILKITKNFNYKKIKKFLNKKTKLQSKKKIVKFCRESKVETGMFQTVPSQNLKKIYLQNKAKF